jgi:arylsulfatase A-like enzyme
MMAVATNVTPARSAVPQNILFILTDDQTVEEFNVNTMPYLLSEPGERWVKFENAVVNTALCCPSRATILSGQYAHHHGVINNHKGRQLRDSATVATWLNSAGYHTSLIGKYLNGYPFKSVPTNYIPPGWDEWNAFSKEPGYFNYTLNQNGTLVPYGGTETAYSTDVLKKKALQFLRGSAQPFFLYFAPYAAHDPYTPAPQYATAFSNLQMPRSPNFNEADVSDKPEWIRARSLLTARGQQNQDRDRRSQYRALLSVDDAIEEFLSALTDRGILDNTVVVFMSDNGHLLGEHRVRTKVSEYEESQSVPLWIRSGSAVANIERRVVSNVDLASTFTDIAGVNPSIPQDGRSLVPLLNGSATEWRNGALIEWLGETAVGKESLAPPFWGIRTRTYKYVELNTGEKELYDLVLDPYELQNVAGDPAYSQVQADLAAELKTLKQ